MTINILQVYGGYDGFTLQVRGQVDGESLAYNVQPFAGKPLSIPRWLLVRRSSWAAKYGDGGKLPF